MTAPDLKPCPWCKDIPQSISLGMAGQPRWKHPNNEACPIGGYLLGGNDFVAAWNTRAPLAEAVALPTWQPIETAPKDGSRIMLWRGFTDFGEWPEMLIAEWHDGAWRWPDDRENPSTHGEWTDYDLIDGYEDAERPTHWMPLPEPPAALRAIGERAE